MSSRSPRKKQSSSLKQSTLSFKTRKSGSSAQLKVKKSRQQTAAKEAERPRAKVDSEDDEAHGSDQSRLLVHGSESEDDQKMEVNVERPELDMKDRAGRYSRYLREAKEKMGWIRPIHNQGQTKIHDMLRVFDNTYEYGPSVGLTRLQRWERAHAMGLNPPPEVRDILLTKQGSEDPHLVHNVFHGLV